MKDQPPQLTGYVAVLITLAGRRCVWQAYEQARVAADPLFYCKCAAGVSGVKNSGGMLSAAPTFVDMSVRSLARCLNSIIQQFSRAILMYSI